MFVGSRCLIHLHRAKAVPALVQIWHSAGYGLGQSRGMRTLVVRDILRLEKKGWHQWTIDEGETVFEATRKMVEYKSGSLCVLRGEKVVGIVTERDYLQKIVHEGRTSKETLVSEISTMDNKLVVASPNDTIQDCVDVMAAKNIRHLPIADKDGSVMGLLSIRDIARALSRERAEVLHEVEELRSSRDMPIHDG